MKPSMLAKLDQLADRLAELNDLLAQPDITTDLDQYRKLTREHAELGPLVALYAAFTDAARDIPHFPLIAQIAAQPLIEARMAYDAGELGKVSLNVV